MPARRAVDGSRVALCYVPSSTIDACVQRRPAFALFGGRGATDSGQRSVSFRAALQCSYNHRVAPQPSVAGDSWPTWTGTASHGLRRPPGTDDPRLLDQRPGHGLDDDQRRLSPDSNLVGEDRSCRLEVGGESTAGIAARAVAWADLLSSNPVCSTRPVGATRRHQSETGAVSGRAPSSGGGRSLPRLRIGCFGPCRRFDAAARPGSDPI
jgi:hypothetical protein